MSWINILSIDAVVVTVAWQSAATAHWTGRQPRAIETLAVALAAWIVYTADRWLDANGPNRIVSNLSTRAEIQISPTTPMMPRHLFYRCHRVATLWVWLVAVLTLGLVSGCRLPGPVVISAAACGSIVLLYLVSRAALKRPRTVLVKSVCVGGFVAAGTHLVAATDTIPAIEVSATEFSVAKLAVAVLTTACLVARNCVAVQRIKTAGGGVMGKSVSLSAHRTGSDQFAESIRSDYLAATLVALTFGTLALAGDASTSLTTYAIAYVTGWLGIATLDHKFRCRDWSPSDRSVISSCYDALLVIAAGIVYVG